MLSDKKAKKFYILISSGEDTHDLCSLSYKKWHLMKHMIDVHQEGQTGFKREEEQLMCLRTYLKTNSLFKTKSYKRLNSIFFVQINYIIYLKYKAWHSFKDLLSNFVGGLSFCFFSNAPFKNLIDMKKLNTQICFDLFTYSTRYKCTRSTIIPTDKANLNYLCLSYS